MSKIRFLEEEVRHSRTEIYYFTHEDYGEVELHDVYEDDKYVDSYAYDKWGKELSFTFVNELIQHMDNMKIKRRIKYDYNEK